MIIKGSIVTKITYPIVITIEKKALILEIEHDDDDIYV